MSAPITAGLPQPNPGPSVNANTNPAHPSVARIAPGTSRASRSPTVSRSENTASTTMTTPIGTLIRKIHRHDTW